MTNKLFIFALLLTVFSTANLSAQKLGLRAEYGIQSLSQESTYLVSANRSIDYKLSTKSITPSRSIGVFTQFEFGWMFFQPEVLYTTYEQTLELESYTEEASPRVSNEFVESFQQFDIPLYAGVKFKNVKIGVGPVFHIGQNIDSELSSFNKIELRPSTISAGIQTGVGIDFKFFSLDLKYQNDFNQATDHIYFNNYNRNLNNSVSSFRVGMAFAIGKK